MDTQRFRTREFNTLNLRGRCQPRDILRIGTSPDTFTQVIRDTPCNSLIRHLAAVDFSLKSDDMKAVARRYWLCAKLTGRKRLQRALEFGGRLAFDDLPEITALLG